MQSRAGLLSALGEAAFFVLVILYIIIMQQSIIIIQLIIGSWFVCLSNTGTWSCVQVTSHPPDHTHDIAWQGTSTCPALCVLIFLLYVGGRVISDQKLGTGV